MTENLNVKTAATAAAAGEVPHAEEPRDPRFFWLTVFQYVLIAAVAIVFVWLLAGGVKTKGDLGDIDDARGLITFVIAVGTIAIAIMLTLMVILIRDFEKRLAAGKEILTILVAVLGTIVGFYYGAAKKETAAAPAPTQISAAAAKITPPELARDGKSTISVSLTGGTAPYRYTIKFTPDTITPIPEKESANGEINEEISGASLPPGTKEVLFVIEGKDKAGVAFAVNKDGKQKIPVR